MFDTKWNKTYSCDLPLFERLGLKPFSNLPMWEETFVGEVRSISEWSVKIWVTCSPAQFWKAEIYCPETDTITVIVTGSGSLEDYWETFKKIAQGMVIIKSMWLTEGEGE